MIAPHLTEFATVALILVPIFVQKLNLSDKVILTVT